jgi:spore maturation protein CgeB
MTMRILLAAPVSFDRITYFISDYFVGLARACKKLGHDVRLVKTTENLYNPLIPNRLTRDFHTLRRYLKPLVDAPHDLLLMKQLLQEVEVFKPDLLLMHVIDTSYLAHIIPQIRSRGTHVLVWMGVHPSQVSEGVHALLRKANRTLYYDKSYREYYEKALGIENLFILPLGCDIDHFNAIVPESGYSERAGVDVCFAGLFDHHREKYLQALSEFDLGIWSWNIGDFDTPLKKFHRGNAYGDDLIRIYKSAKIVLNIHRSFERNGGNYRLFEIPASGAFQLVDDKPGLSAYFTVGKELGTFSDEKDLKDKVAYYLANEQERAAIARAGHERVSRDHTLVKRMEYLLDSMEMSS